MSSGNWSSVEGNSCLPLALPEMYAFSIKHSKIKILTSSRYQSTCDNKNQMESIDVKHTLRLAIHYSLQFPKLSDSQGSYCQMVNWSASALIPFAAGCWGGLLAWKAAISKASSTAIVLSRVRLRSNRGSLVIL